MPPVARIVTRRSNFAGGKIVGALGATTRGTTAPFDAQSLETLRLVAEQAGLAITKDRLLKQVEARVQALEQASRHKDDFLALLSHELHTPLNAILSFGQMPADEQLTNPLDVQQAVDDIIVSGRLLLVQVNDLLDMARIEAGQITVEWADVPLAPLLHACKRVVAPLLFVAKRRQRAKRLSPQQSLPAVTHELWCPQNEHLCLCVLGTGKDCFQITEEPAWYCERITYRAGYPRLTHDPEVKTWPVGWLDEEGP